MLLFCQVLSKKILNLVLKSLCNDLVQEMKNAFFNLFIFKKKTEVKPFRFFYWSNKA